MKHWADIQNLKIAAASYSQAGSIAELEKQIAAKSTLAKTARESLVETERQLKDFGQVLKSLLKFYQCNDSTIIAISSIKNLVSSTSPYSSPLFQLPFSRDF